MVAGQVGHGGGERHVVVVLGMVVISLEAVMHVRDLGLIIIAARVRVLVGIVSLPGVTLARVHRARRR